MFFWQHWRGAPLSAVLLALTCGSLLSGCAGDYAGGTETSTSQFDTIQKTVFNTRCTTGPCHSLAGNAGGLVLEPGVSYANLVDAPSANASAHASGLLRVKPSSADDSFLYIKLVTPSAPQGSRMPQGQAPLTDADLTLIRDWITAGAPGPSEPQQPTATATQTPVPSETPTPLATSTGTLMATATVTATATPPLATLSLIQSTIFSPTCATAFCHDSVTHSGNLNLEAGSSYTALIGATADNLAAQADGLLRVSAGDPGHSFLLTKLNLATIDARYFSPMPLVGGKLSPDKIALVTAWIARGAPND